MDAFITRKRKRVDVPEPAVATPDLRTQSEKTPHEEESTDFKLALLASLHQNTDEGTLLEALLACDGSVDQASEWLAQSTSLSPRKRPAPTTVGYQSSLSSFRTTPAGTGPAKKALVKKGQTLYLYTPEDIEAHTPCSIIHNFLPAKQADDLLLQLVDEAPSYQSLEFKLFDRVVWSPHTFCFYVNSLEEAEVQKTDYTYDGRKLEVRMKLCSQNQDWMLRFNRMSDRAHLKCSKHVLKLKKQ